MVGGESAAPTKTVSPSGMNRRALAGSSRSSQASSLPERVSQTRTVLSREAEAN